MENCAVVGTFASIFGLFLSGYVIWITGSINNALRLSNKINEFNDNRESLLNRLTKCKETFLEESTSSELRKNIDELDLCFSDFLSIYPYNKKNKFMGLIFHKNKKERELIRMIEEKRKELKKEETIKSFSYLEFSNEIHDVCIILKRSLNYEKCN